MTRRKLFGFVSLIAVGLLVLTLRMADQRETNSPAPLATAGKAQPADSAAPGPLSPPAAISASAPLTQLPASHPPAIPSPSLPSSIATSPAAPADPSTRSDREPTPAELAAGFRFDRLVAKPKNRLLTAPGFPARSAQVLASQRVVIQTTLPLLGGLQTLALNQADGTRADLETRLAALQASGLYAYVEPDFIVTTNATPNDPRYASGELWGLHNLGQDAGTDDADIDAPEAWDLRSSAPGVVVAVIDTGVRYTHEDIAANMWTNPGEIPANGIDDDNNGYIDDVYGIDARNADTDPFDDNRHGTHCAGTIAAVGNNGKGVTGVAWQAKIMALKFLGAKGSGYNSDALTCIQYATANGAQIMSNSWGGGGYSQALRDAIAAARAQGILFVASAGNSSANSDTAPQYPANYQEDNVVAVAATDRTDALGSFSNYGNGSVEIAAPGVKILSLGHTTDDAYTTLSGTSMAGPHVAGALALLKAQFPADTYRQLINRLQNGADQLPSLSGKIQNGGRLNLDRALRTTSKRPINDTFAAAAKLYGQPLRIRAALTGATREFSEPLHAGAPNPGPSVWWVWTPATSGTITLNTFGSTFDTRLAIYTGSSLNALTAVAANDNESAEILTSKLTFTATAGTPYLIAISGPAGATGRIDLRVGDVPFEKDVPDAPRPVPVNNNFAQAALVKPVDYEDDPERPERQWLVSNAWMDGCTKEPGEPDHAGNPGGVSLWYKWVAPYSGRFSASTSYGFYTDHENTLLAIYTGTRVDQLTLVAANDDLPPERSALFQPSPSKLSWLTFDATAGVTYYIAVDGYNGKLGSVELVITPEVANDTFASRSPITGSTVTVDTTGASWEPGEPAHTPDGGGTTVWRTWTAPTTGLYLFSAKIIVNYTQNLRGAANFAIYTGDSLPTLTRAATLEAGRHYLTDSRYTYLQATAGTTYSIALDSALGFDTVQDGEITLAIDRIPGVNEIPNDALANATVITDVSRSYFGNTPNATREAIDPPVSGQPVSRSLWWKWTAGPTTTRLALSMFKKGSQFTGYPWLSVFKGTGTNLTAVADFSTPATLGFNNISYGNKAIDVIPGTTYHIRLATLDGDTGGIVEFRLIANQPVARADTYVPARFGIPLTLNVLENDLSPSGRPLRVIAMRTGVNMEYSGFTDTTITIIPINEMPTKRYGTSEYTITDGVNTAFAMVYFFFDERTRQKFQRYHWNYDLMTYSDAADTNNNGVNNLLEYALGGDYTAPDTSIPLVHPRPNLDPLTSRLQLVFNRYLARTDLQLTVQAADSPAGPWIDIARSTGGNAFTALVTGTGIAETGTGDARQVTVTDPISGPRRFLRLAVNSP
jgi:subtilisin family serine protease